MIAMHSFLQEHSKFVRAVLVLVQIMSRKNNLVKHACMLEGFGFVLDTANLEAR